MRKDTKKTEKQQKRTHMTGGELKRIRLEMRFDPRDMRATLALPGCKPMPRRTYQDYEAGKRGIPAEMATRIRETIQRDREFMAGIGARVDAADRGDQQ